MKALVGWRYVGVDLNVLLADAAPPLLDTLVRFVAAVLLLRAGRRIS